MSISYSSPSRIAGLFAAGALFASSALALVSPMESSRRSLSASFGEYRPGHLHAGIDFATFGKIGLGVRSIAAGRVYRVKSSRGGYGNVIYIQHADGTRSVYAHLESFSPRIAALLPRRAHRLGGDASGEGMEVYPREGLNVREGEIIGATGESGAGIPHFHFEMRDRDDRPVNPIALGRLQAPDRVRPTLSAVIIEPADPSSSVNGSALPLALDSSSSGGVVHVEGSCRILVAGYDEDGRLGGALGLDRIRMKVDGETWSEVLMRSFTYGRDREVGQVYDLFRTGFGPTTYVYDLTGPDGAGEVLRSRGRLNAADRRNLQIVLADMAGNEIDFSLQLVPGNRPAPSGPDTEHISGGGLVVRRRGEERRFTDESAGSLHGLTCLGAVARSGTATPLAGGGDLYGAPDGLAVWSILGGSISPPAQAISTPIQIGPFGGAAGRSLAVRVPAGEGCNGAAAFWNGSWRWIGGVREGTHVKAVISFLSPVVAVRDTMEPTAMFDTSTRPALLRIRDDFSGVEAESVRVAGQRGERTVRIEGRFDADRDAFLPEPGAMAGIRSVVIEASDRAGNRLSARLVRPDEDGR